MSRRSAVSAVWGNDTEAAKMRRQERKRHDEERRAKFLANTEKAITEKMMLRLKLAPRTVMAQIIVHLTKDE